MTNCQRVFDLLAAAPDTWFSKSEIVAALKASHDSIVDALTWLTRNDKLDRKAEPSNGRRGRRWLFRIKPGASRPADGRSSNGANFRPSARAT